MTSSDAASPEADPEAELARVRRTLAGSERFHTRLLDAVQEAVIATDLHGRVVYWNKFAESLYGWSAQEALGRNVVDLNVSPAAQVDAHKIMGTLRSGGTWSGEIVLTRRDGSTFPAHVSDAPIHDNDGNLIGIVGISYDITPRKAWEEKQSLLIRELHHRVKNMLSTVQAIMGTTARTATSLQDFQAAFSGRIAALANTQSLLTDDPQQSALFRDLLRSELDPYDDRSGKRILLDGPRVLLPSDIAVPVGMAVHELTTNAVKHGALSRPSGAVVVRWQETRDTGRRLLWHWNEANGPAVEAPTREGFGTQLLQRVLTTQIGADVRIDFTPDGLNVFVLIPLPDQ